MCLLLAPLLLDDNFIVVLRIHPDLSDLRKFTPYLYFWLIPTVAADFIITGMMIYFLV